MNVQHSIFLSGNVYLVQINAPAGQYWTALTPVEVEAFAQFGEPVVEVGGEFTAGELTFTLPTATRRFPSQFPITQQFSEDDFEDAADRADLFRDSILARLTDAKAVVMAKIAKGVGSQITTI